LKLFEEYLFVELLKETKMKRKCKEFELKEKEKLEKELKFDLFEEFELKEKKMFQ